MSKNPESTKSAPPRGSLRTPGAASYTGCSEVLLKKWRGKKVDDPGEHGPRWIAITPRLIVYRISDLDAWLESRAGSTRAQSARGNELAPA
jgi:predicted DNA-binding transcriptional regulator AlpA